MPPDETDEMPSRDPAHVRAALQDAVTRGRTVEPMLVRHPAKLPEGASHDLQAFASTEQHGSCGHDPRNVVCSISCML